jgi:hypothetical protein
MTRPILANFQPRMDAEQACRRMTMRFSRATSCILPALLLLAVWALPASASDQLAPPQKTANVIPLPKKKPPRLHTIKIATIEPLPSSGWVVARYIPLILGVGF